MADGSDDAQQIDALARLVERGVVIASASRYAKAGQQVGGPAFKSLLSRVAGLSLYWIGRAGTRDATNSFKAYNTAFARAARIESDKGFEIGIELVSKARRARLPVAEVPTIWLDRAFGVSNVPTAGLAPPVPSLVPATRSVLPATSMGSNPVRSPSTSRRIDASRCS